MNLKYAHKFFNNPLFKVWGILPILSVDQPDCSLPFAALSPTHRGYIVSAPQTTAATQSWYQYECYLQYACICDKPGPFNLKEVLSIASIAGILGTFIG